MARNHLKAILAVCRRTALMGVFAATAATCTSPTEPVFYTSMNLEVLGVSDLAVLRDSGLLVVFGVPEDTTRILPPHARLKLDLTTSAGDAESFDLAPIVCDDRTLACHNAAVVMNDGRHVRELFSLLNAVPARVRLILFGGESGAIFVFHPEKVPDAIRQLAAHPAVESAERTAFAEFPAPQKWGTRGGLPLDFQPAVRSDGVLQGQPGDTVAVRYTQPDSSFLELKFVLPAG